jgi:hypothetical protein
MKCLVITICFCLLTHTMVSTSAAQGNSSAWQATVKLESAALYAGVSVSTRVVTTLRRGDLVAVNLEITGEGGKWYAVTAPGQSISGYLSAQVLEVQQPEIIAHWEYQPPPEPAPVSEKESSGGLDRAIALSSKGKFDGDIKGIFTSKFGRTLPVSAFGQTRLHNRLGFDHRNSVDVALNPDSPEGRALLGKLRGFGFPFISFRRAIPGIATGPHIHVGKPSRRK